MSIGGYRGERQEKWRSDPCFCMVGWMVYVGKLIVKDGFATWDKGNGGYIMDYGGKEV